jgi:hypothetical protein
MAESISRRSTRRFSSRSRPGQEFGAGIKYAVEKGWLELHESGTYVRLMSAGEELSSR